MALHPSLFQMPRAATQRQRANPKATLRQKGHYKSLPHRFHKERKRVHFYGSCAKVLVLHSNPKSRYSKFLLTYSYCIYIRASLFPFNS